SARPGGDCWQNSRHRQKGAVWWCNPTGSGLRWSFAMERCGRTRLRARCEKITALPEYYLTRAGLEIMQACAPDVAARFPGGATLIELGSGSSAQTRILFAQFLSRGGRLRYIPVDISRTILEESARALLADFPGLEVRAIAGEYQEALAHLREDFGRPKLILWLGSNIGNLDRSEAVEFLRCLRSLMMPEDRLLVGIDLRKDARVLEAAYDDAQGVTAQFNRNILTRINRELGGEVDASLFRHRARYDEDAGRVEMYLVSQVAQTVPISALDLAVSFDVGEAIHTENSYKYSLSEIRETAEAAGLRVECQWLDRGRRFSQNFFAPHEI
ncbi:MAG: Dimethylhistidine N-methyltransferase, partial [Acidobacteria bacterium]|nr:Dimethylhistidine N-methyltransferase [Acidobacteriota bacterium]